MQNCLPYLSYHLSCILTTQEKEKNRLDISRKSQAEIRHSESPFLRDRPILVFKFGFSYIFASSASSYQTTHHTLCHYLSVSIRLISSERRGKFRSFFFLAAFIRVPGKEWECDNVC